jgi:hypothetical protein
MAPMNMKRGNDPRTRTMKLINAEYRVINTEK